MRAAPEVVWADLQTPRDRVYPRGAAGTDPLWKSQWHLHGTPYGVDSDRIGANLTGRGVTIAIVDDGLEWAHPEIAPNYAREHSHNYNDGDDADPQPRGPGDRHGTSAAGVAAAAGGNGHCGRGVAPEAKVAGIRVISGPVSDMVEAQALAHHAASGVDIVSCSWGPLDSGRGMVEPGRLVKRTLALYSGELRGRSGRGTVYLWAAGNGREAYDSCAFDGYASSRFVMAIGALNRYGKRAWYSEGCAALFAVAPSSGAQAGIITADLTGVAGYERTECTSNFGGTSAAAPLAAGIVALMLQKRPELTSRDIMHVVARGATPVNRGDGSWHRNGRGYAHSEAYGFGLLKLLPLMAALRSHKQVPKHAHVWSSGMRIVRGHAGDIPCGVDAPVSDTGLEFIEHVELRVSLAHVHRGELRITLRSPEGAVSEMAPARPLDENANYPLGGWLFTSVRHWGEHGGNGTWRIEVIDPSGRAKDNNHFHAYTLSITGY